MTGLLFSMDVIAVVAVAVDLALFIHDWSILQLNRMTNHTKKKTKYRYLQFSNSITINNIYSQSRETKTNEVTD